jgi:hypothetical protein
MNRPDMILKRTATIRVFQNGNEVQETLSYLMLTGPGLRFARARDCSGIFCEAVAEQKIGAESPVAGA